MSADSLGIEKLETCSVNVEVEKYKFSVNKSFVSIYSLPLGNIVEVEQESPIAIAKSMKISLKNTSDQPIRIRRGQPVAIGKILGRRPIEVDDIFDNEFTKPHSNNATINVISAARPLLNLTRIRSDIHAGDPSDPIIKAKSALLEKIAHLTISQQEEILKYENIFLPDGENEKFTFLNTPEIDVPVNEDIPTEINPPYTKHLAQDDEEALTEFVIKSLKSGLIEKVNNPTIASPALIRGKRDGSKRFLTDPRRVNKHLKNVLIPQNPDTAASSRNITSCSIWAKFDIKSAFLRQKVKLRSRKYSTFRVSQGPMAGFYQFVGLGVGLKSSTALFILTMIDILNPLATETVSNGKLSPMLIFEVFVDDLIIGESTPEKMFLSLIRLLRRLDQFNVKLDPKKSEFLVKELEWCGSIIKKNEISPDLTRFTQLQDIKTPQSLNYCTTEWRHFFGLFSYFRRYIPSYAHHEQSIRSAIEDCKNKIITRDDLEKKVSEIMQIFIDCITKGCLKIPSPGSHIYIDTDASCHAGSFVAYYYEEDGDGASENKTKHIMWYGSKSFTSIQKTYRCHEKELLAVLMALDKIKHIIAKAKSVTLRSDNLTNVMILSNQSTPHEISNRTLRLILQIQTKLYTEKIKFVHLTSLANFVSDAASRLTTESAQIQVITRAQSAQNARHDSQLQQLKQIHDSTHSSAEKLLKTCEAYGLEWDTLRQDATDIVKNCAFCFQHKRLLASTIMGSIQMPSKEMEIMVVDHLHLKTECINTGSKYVLTCIDTLSRYLFTFPLRNKTAASAASAVKLLISMFPQIACLRGDNFFDCQEFRDLGKALKISAVHASRSNLVERCHRTLWEKLETISRRDSLPLDKMDTALAEATAMYNAQHHSSTGVAPEQFFRNRIWDGSSDPKFEASASLSKLRKTVKNRLAGMQFKNCSDSKIPILPPDTKILVRYHHKQKVDIEAVVVADYGLTCLVQKCMKKNHRYRQVRVSKRHIFVDKNGSYQKMNLNEFIQQDMEWE